MKLNDVLDRLDLGKLTVDELVTLTGIVNYHLSTKWLGCDLNQMKLIALRAIDIEYSRTQCCAKPKSELNATLAKLGPIDADNN